MAQLEGMRLGSCSVLRHIGGGGMGEVYLAEQPALGREVVVKLVRDAGLAMADADAREQGDRQFAQEARAIAALDHPHILPLFEYGEQDDLHYLVMPYIEHGSLADLIQPTSADASAALSLPLQPLLVADIIDQCADALQFAHLHGVVHRDVKPGNLLVRVLPSSPPTMEREASDRQAPLVPLAGRFHILLADFGLARFLNGLNPNTGTIGTPLYSAPEQYAGQPVPATDQYALACVTYFLLAGQPVFQGTLAELYHQHISVDPLPVTSINPLLPPAVDTVLSRALAKSPAARFPQMVDFARALRAALDPMTPVSRPLWLAGALPASALAPRLPVVPVAQDYQDPRQEQASSPVRADGTTQLAGDARLRKVATLPGWRTPRAASASWSPRPARNPRRVPQHPDAPGSPLPRRRRVRRRLIALVGVGVLVLATLGGAGWAITLYLSNAMHTVMIARSGVVSLEHAPELASPGAGAGTSPLAAPLLVRARWTEGESAAVAQAADHVAALPPLAPAPTLPTQVLAPLQTTGGPGQAQTGLARPGQVAVGASSQFVVAALDDALQVVSLQPQGQPGPARVVAARSLVAPVLHPGDALGQPRMLFDADSRRWVIVLAEVAGAPSAVGAGYFDLAISDGMDPLASWHVYQFSTSVPAFGGCTWADDPQIGSNAASYALTGNDFACGAGEPFRGAALWDVPKQPFLRGVGTRVYLFTGFANAQQQPVFTLTPAVQTGVGTTQWLVSTDAGYADRGRTSNGMIVWAVIHTGTMGDTLPTLVGLVVSVPYSYADPPAVASGAARVPIGDARPAQLQMADGHLYTAFTTAVNWAGDASTRSGIYWLDIVPQLAPSAAITAGRPALAARINQAGVFGAAQSYAFAPSMRAAGGDIGLVAAVSSAELAPRVAYTMHRASEPPGTLGRQTSWLLANSPLLLGDGQWGTSLASGAGDSGAGHAPTLWIAGVVASGSPSQWHAQLWHL